MRWLLWLPYSMCSAANLWGHVAGHQATMDISQQLLMPLLAFVLVARGSARLVPALLALGFSFIGDAGPKYVEADLRFPVMIGAFFVAQLAWIAALRPEPGRYRELLRGRGRLAGYALFALVLVVLCVPHAGALAPAVLAYALALLIMAVMAAARGRAGWGGALFMLSDGLIALTTFVPALRGHDLGLIIMGTYVVAQAMLVVALPPRAAAVASAP